MMSTCASTLACTAAEGGTGDPLVRMCQSTDSAPGLQVRVPLLHCMLCAIVMRGCFRSYLLPAMSGRGGCRTCIDAPSSWPQRMLPNSSWKHMISNCCAMMTYRCSLWLVRHTCLPSVRMPAAACPQDPWLLCGVLLVTFSACWLAALGRTPGLEPQPAGSRTCNGAPTTTPAALKQASHALGEMLHYFQSDLHRCVSACGECSTTGDLLQATADSG